MEQFKIEQLRDLLNEKGEIKWDIDDDSRLVAPDINDKYIIDEYINKVFPIETWNNIVAPDSFEGITGLFYIKDIDTTLPFIEQKDHNPYHAVTYSEIWNLIEELEDFIINFRLDENFIYITSRYSFSLLKLPVELNKIITEEDNQVSIPLIYIPLFLDYYNSYFPIYYPENDTMNKLIEYLQNYLRRKYPKVVLSNLEDYILIRTDLPSYNSVYRTLINLLGENNVEKALGSILISNVHSVYRQLWNQHVNNLLESEHRDQFLLERLGDLNLVELVDRKLFQPHPVYKRVFKEPRQRLEGMTRQIIPRLGRDLSLLIEQYESNLVPFPTLF